MPLTARRAKLADAYYVASRLRGADKAELDALGHTDYLQPLLQGIAQSDPCYTIITPDERPCAIFGVMPVSTPEFGVVWLLGTDEVTANGRDFLRQSSRWMKRMHKKYAVLYNHVDYRNKVHLRWLKWIGCSFTNVINLGPDKLPFKEFVHLKG